MLGFRIKQLFDTMIISCTPISTELGIPMLHYGSVLFGVQWKIDLNPIFSTSVYMLPKLNLHTVLDSFIGIRESKKTSIIRKELLVRLSKTSSLFLG